MLTAWMNTTRPWASVIHRPSWPSGGAGPAAAAAGATAARNAATIAVTHTIVGFIRIFRINPTIAAASRGSRRGGHCTHRLEGCAGEAADHDDVERVVADDLGLRGICIGRGHPDRSLRLPEPSELTAIAIVQVTVEGLNLREPLGRVVADRRADISEYRRRLATRFCGARMDVPPRTGG